MLEDDFNFVAPGLGPDSIVIEVGANCGEHTAGFSDRAGWVWAFEAHPLYTRKQFEEKWGAKKNVTWIQKAVGKAVGPVTFHASRGGSNGGKEYTNSSSLRPPTEECVRRWPPMEFRKMTAEGTTLDAELWRLIQEEATVNVLWLDCQGGERDVFLGAPDLLKRTELVYVEGHQGQYEGAPSWTEIERILGAAGLTGPVWEDEERRVYRRLLKRV